MRKKLDISFEFASSHLDFGIFPDSTQIFTVHKVSLSGISYLIQERHLWDFRCYRRGDIHGPARSQGGVLRLLSSNKSDVSEDEDDSGDEGDKYYDDLSIMAYRQG